MTQQTYQQLDFLKHLTPKTQPQRIPSMPLDFDCLSADIITKELTKLNNPHPYRIHYLGPRPHHSAQLHKRYGRQWNSQTQSSTEGYQLSLRSTGNHCFSNRQQLNSQTQFFYRAFEGMNPTLKGKNCYVFNAAFEGGNLDSVVKVGQAEFDLFLRVDSNTRGHTGWFYFSIKNGSLKQKIKLNLCNLKKHAKLYEQGMTPFVYSTKSHLQRKTEWMQSCTNVTFDQQLLRFDFVYERIESYPYNKLSFQYEFKYENDEVFFAYCVPYTYSKLQSDIREYCKNEKVKQYSLGLSLTGLQLPLLHITDRNSNSSEKKYIIVTGRVHPGESNSSHQVHGLVNWLIGDSKQAQFLLKQTHFFIIPMINPDGVVLGNTRTSVSGKDLNRQFTTNNSELFPEVLFVKNFVSKLQKRGTVMLYIDFHGHSMRKNTFLYGPNYNLAHSEFLRCRLLPKIIQKIQPSFRYYSCSFFISECKKTTARAIMLNQMKIPYVYTIQSSNGLFYDPIEMKTVQFTESQWKQMGKSIGKAIAEFNCMMIELQNMAKQRKQSRDTKKRDKLGFLLERKLTKQNKEQQSQLINKAKGYPQMYMQLLNEIKMDVENEKKVEDQADSDDYDEAEDISTKKLSSFTNALANYKKETNSFYKQHIQRQRLFQQFPNNNTNSIDKNCPVKMFDFDFSDFQQSPSTHELTKNTKKIVLENKRLKATMKSVQQSQKRKHITDRIVSRNSLESCASKKSVSVYKSLKKQAAPLTIYPPKPRYSLINRNSMFPVQTNLQSIKIPKDLKILRREMKKGRLLISNLEESRLKFVSLEEREFQQSNKIREKVSNPKIGRTIQRPSTGCLHSATVNLNEQVRLRPTQPYLHGIDNFISLNGESGDFNGLVIKAVRRRC